MAEQTPGNEDQQPLSGYRVLDLSGAMGVYCGKLMADMGADVIKVEPPGGDAMRRIGPFVHQQPHPENSLHWLHFNTNKRSITLDFATTEGTALLRQLAGKADVLLETGSPGYMDSLGLGYEDLTAENPGLVYVSMTPFGQTGPYKDFKASDLVGFAMGGYMYITGWPHTPPNKLWGSQAYNTTSNRAFTATLLALYDRLNTGLGQRIDVAMQEAVAATTEMVNTHYHYEGVNAIRCGFRHGGAFIATWRCKDGYFSLITNSRRAWDDVRDWMARDGVVDDLMEEKYDELFVLRGEHEDHIEGLIQEWALGHTRQEISDWGLENHHPWGQAATPEEVAANPQLWDRGFFIKVDSPRHGTTLVYPGAPYKLSETPWRLRNTAPSIGQHNAEVYCGELGLSTGDLEVLVSAGAI